LRITPLATNVDLWKPIGLQSHEFLYIVLLQSWEPCMSTGWMAFLLKQIFISCCFYPNKQISLTLHRMYCSGDHLVQNMTTHGPCLSLSPEMARTHICTLYPKWNSHKHINRGELCTKVESVMIYQVTLRKGYFAHVKHELPVCKDYWIRPITRVTRIHQRRVV